MDSTEPPSSPTRSTREIAAESTELSSNLNAANHRLLVLIAEFDRRGGWAEDAAKSCAHWLHWSCGLNLGAAREKVRVAHALRQLPQISAAMERGELSYAKVRAVTRVADESTEGHFLQIALSGTAHDVERVVSRFRDATDSAEVAREAKQQAERALHYWWEPDGSLTIRARIPAESGALVLRALDRVVEAMPSPAAMSLSTVEDRPLDSVDGNPPSWSQRRADALGVVAESYLAHGATALAAGDRHQVIVHVDAQTLCTRAPGRCEIEEGPSVAAETARRLACDGGLVTIVEDGRGEPLDVGRKTRAIPPAMRRALAARDRGCRIPGCTHTRFVDGHHVQHWADGGETKLANLLTLCRFHHAQVHAGRIRIERLDDGAWLFSKPDGAELVAVLPQHTRPIAELNRERGLEITPQTAAMRRSVDYGIAIERLLRRAGLRGALNTQRNGELALKTSGESDLETSGALELEKISRLDPERNVEWMASAEASADTFVDNSRFCG